MTRAPALGEAQLLRDSRLSGETSQVALYTEGILVSHVGTLDKRRASYGRLHTPKCALVLCRGKFR